MGRLYNPLGATAPSPPDRVIALQRQINRFATPAGAQALGMAIAAVAESGVLDFVTAQTACMILAKRAIDATAVFPDSATRKVATEAVMHVAAPLPYVPDNLEEITKAISMLADHRGLGRRGMDWRIVAGVAVGAFALYHFTKKRGRR